MAQRKLDSDPHALLADFLKEIRQEADLSQRGLAKSLGRTQSWVYQREVCIYRVELVDFVQWCQACNANPGEAFQKYLRSLA